MFRTCLSFTFMLMALIVLGIGCGSDDGDNGNGPVPVPEPRVVVQTHQDPTLPGAVTSPVWDSITAVEIPIGTDVAYNAGLGAITNKTVDMKALIADDSLLYIWVQWNDNDEDNRFGELHANWINNRVEWELIDSSFFNEDRFYLLFDNGGPSGADCATLCHASQSAAGRLFYGAPGDDADIWHWKACRTAPALFAEDMHITDTKVAPDPQYRPQDSLYYANYGIDQVVGIDTFWIPQTMHSDSTNEFTGNALLEDFHAPFNGSLDWVTFLPLQPPSGKYVPRYKFFEKSLSQGSRWDVRAASFFNGSAWTVVFRRVLTTADGDDLSFDFSSLDSVAVSIATCDDSGMEHHGRAPFYLVFQ